MEPQDLSAALALLGTLAAWPCRPEGHYVPGGGHAGPQRAAAAWRYYLGYMVNYSIDDFRAG